MRGKSLVLEGLYINLDDDAPNQLARITFIAYATKQNSVRTQAYAAISGSVIRWAEQLRVPYQGQDHISFETQCEFEYGFKKEQMKSRFEGIIYLKEQFFVLNGSSQVFRTNGQKAGSLSYVVKMTSVNPAFGKVREKTPEEIEEDVYQPDFKGRVVVYAATVKIKEPSQLKAKKMVLRVRLGNNVQKTKESEEGKWTDTLKFDRYEQSTIDCELLDAVESQLIIARGHLLLETLERNKRFTIQSVTLNDLGRRHIGQLILDMRFVDKEELTSMRINSKNPRSRPRHNASSMEIPKESPKADAKSHSILTKKAKIAGLNQSLVSMEDIRSDLRYKKVHVINDYNEIIIPRAKRFPDKKPANPYISYVDPEEVSIFRPSGKGASIGLGNKHDFTAVRRQNPGVGQYRLPSIWDKY